MPNKYISTPVKQAIVNARIAGQTNRAVANLFNIGKSSVDYIYKKHLHEGLAL
jgi:hypothetical protein